MRAASCASSVQTIEERWPSDGSLFSGRIANGPAGQEMLLGAPAVIALVRDRGDDARTDHSSSRGWQCRRARGSPNCAPSAATSSRADSLPASASSTSMRCEGARRASSRPCRRSGSRPAPAKSKPHDRFGTKHDADFARPLPPAHAAAGHSRPCARTARPAPYRRRK